jgi:hypothetical protein
MVERARGAASASARSSRRIRAGGGAGEEAAQILFLLRAPFSKEVREMNFRAMLRGQRICGGAAPGSTEVEASGARRRQRDEERRRGKQNVEMDMDMAESEPHLI